MLASPALALATTTAQSFNFPTRATVKVQVRFYTDAAATSGNEIASGSGTRDLVITTTGAVHDAAGYRNYALTSAIDGGSEAGAVGGTWYPFLLADGLSQLNVAASGGANPGTANSYRIILDVE